MDHKIQEYVLRLFQLADLRKLPKNFTDWITDTGITVQYCIDRYKELCSILQLVYRLEQGTIRYGYPYK
jgi:hypothetical protein